MEEIDKYLINLKYKWFKKQVNSMEYSIQIVDFHFVMNFFIKNVNLIKIGIELTNIELT